MEKVKIEIIAVNLKDIIRTSDDISVDNSGNTGTGGGIAGISEEKTDIDK